MYTLIISLFVLHLHVSLRFNVNNVKFCCFVHFHVIDLLLRKEKLSYRRGTARRALSV